MWAGLRAALFAGVAMVMSAAAAPVIGAERTEEGRRTVYGGRGRL